MACGGGGGGGGIDNYLTIVLHFTVRSNPHLILAKHHLIKMST